MLSTLWRDDVVAKLEPIYHMSEQPTLVATMNAFICAKDATTSKEFRFPRRVGKTATCLAYALQLCAEQPSAHVLFVVNNAVARDSLQQRLVTLEWPAVTSRVRVFSKDDADAKPLDGDEWVIVDECAYVDKWPTMQTTIARAIGITTPFACLHNHNLARGAPGQAQTT